MDRTPSITAVVVGGANMDVVARSGRAVVPETSNPGQVSLSAGGVGRNVAECLARLGTPCQLVAAVGSDAFADLVLEATRSSGVVIDHVRRAPGATGTYVAVLDERGELVTAVSDMAATEGLTAADVVVAAGLIASADLLVLDGNLGPGVLVTAWDLATDAGVRVVLDPVSVPKAVALAPFLDGRRPLYALTPNLAELDAMGGSAADLHARGVEQLWVRRGAEGSTLSSEAGSVSLSAISADVVDVTGAGDAMLAGFCHALLRGADPEEAAAYGHAAAALTVASAHTVRPDLSDELVRSLVL